MKVETNHNPEDLIDQIGNRFFDICDQSWDEIYRHPNHPYSIRIRDCKDDVIIDVRALTIEDTRIAADALLQLLNQEYEIC